MKKVPITIEFDDEKLRALGFFMGKAIHSDPKVELGKALEALYEKHVPADTREFLESSLPASAKAKPKPQTKPAAPLPRSQPALVPSGESEAAR